MIARPDNLFATANHHYGRCNRCGIDAWVIGVDCTLVSGWFVCGRCMEKLQDRSIYQRAAAVAKIYNDRYLGSRRNSDRRYHAKTTQN